MPPPARRPIALQPGTPVADAVTRAREASARADAAGLDAAYQQAVGLAAGDPPLWSALAADHAEGLRKLGRVTLALRRCDEYVDVGPNHISLRLLRAEIRSSLGDHCGAGADAAAIRTALGGQPHALTPDDSARLHRVQGLAAADMGDLDSAVNHLDAARRGFLEAGNQAGVAAIELDRLQIEVRQGDEPAVSDVLSGEPPQTVSDYLLRAVALRRQLRYEAAFLVLWRGVDHDIDPALGWHVWYELILLLRLMRQDELAERLFPSLRAAAAASADPPAAAAAVARLSAAGVSRDALSPRFDRRVQHARRLIIETRLEEAESLLGELHPLAHTDRDISTWHLAAGELGLVRRKRSEIRCCAQAAVGHLTEAVTRASAVALVEVRVCALRSLGHAYDRLDDERAAACWAEAHQLEEGIAGRQLTDDVRIGMLQAAPDEYDERINAAAEKLNNRGPEATAAIVVAMEAARGATILGRILPDENGFARVLPSPSDLNGAWQWVSDIADRLPPAQAAWIIHSTPDQVHHAIVGRGLLYYKSVLSWRKKLTNAIDGLMACWSSEETLEGSITGGEFDESLKKIATQIGIDAVIPRLRRLPHVHRIAIVAGGELSDIPFAALTATGETEPLGFQFALSDLPCLSARLPLYRRSRRLRGERLLSISPLTGGLARAAGRRAHTALDAGGATRARLAAELELRRHRLVRIDCHGLHEHHDPTMSWLQLAPAGPDDGRLRAAELQRMDLRGCGTLVLGACESGMSQRIGRDERIGFVRAAVQAGAPAVIAARWIAKDAVAATVLDRFEHYVRYLPRDLALQRAQLDVCAGAPGVPADIPAVDHPARWACWTLYGDSGWQTRAGPVRRALRRSLDERRRRAKHP